MTTLMLAADRRTPVFASGARSLHLAVLLFTLIFIGALSAQDLPRKAIAKTAPTYPELAKRMHITGKVRVEVDIAASGAVNSARLVGGNPVFEKSAIEAVKQWRFEPGSKETKVVIILEFAGE